MKNAINWFTHNHVAANFLMIVILVSGFAASGYYFERDPWRSFLSERGDDDRPSEEVLLDDVKDDFRLERYEGYFVIQGDDVLSVSSVKAIRRMVDDL